jgi:hypothetical protein
MLFQQRDSADQLAFQFQYVNIRAGQGGTGGTYSQRHPYHTYTRDKGDSQQISIKIVRNGY